MRPSEKRLENGTFSPPLSGPVLRHFLWKILKKQFRIVLFFGAVSRVVFYWFLVNFRCVFQTFVVVVGEWWIQSFLSHFPCQIIDLKGLGTQFVRHFGALSSAPFLERNFSSFLCFPRSLLAHFRCRKGFGVDFDGSENLIEKNVLEHFLRILRKGGGAL